MIEIFLAVVLVSVAFLWHSVSLLSGQRLMRSEASHGTALQMTRHLLERVRTDPEWATLHARLAALQDEPRPPLGHDASRYYADFETPHALGKVGVLVEVPRAAANGALPDDPLVLREDIVASRFGLPFDLSGDGAVDAAAHDTDYRSLPIIVHLVWQPPGEPVQALTVATWLRGIQ